MRFLPVPLPAGRSFLPQQVVICCISDTGLWPWTQREPLPSQRWSTGYEGVCAILVRKVPARASGRPEGGGEGHPSPLDSTEASLRRGAEQRPQGKEGSVEADGCGRGARSEETQAQASRRQREARDCSPRGQNWRMRQLSGPRPDGGNWDLSLGWVWSQEMP